jgi:hypothetical protein
VNDDALLQPSGSEEFDHARALIAAARDDEALDAFEMTCRLSGDRAVRASAAAFAAGILLAQGKPWEAMVWAETVRSDGANPDLANLLEASARLQLGEIGDARALLAGVVAPSDPWFPCSPSSVRIVGAHAAYLDGDVDHAAREVRATYEADPYCPDVWDAIARLVAETDFDVEPIVALVPDDRALEVLAALRNSSAEGVSRIAELFWTRNPGDARVLALVPSFAARLDSVEAMQWSARMRAAGMGRTCPLLQRAENTRVPATERARAAALAHASFGDRRARDLLERAAAAISDGDIVSTLLEVWTIAPAFADSVVVAAATTPHRSLAIAAALTQQGAVKEAYAVLVHGLGLQAADDLTTEDVLALLPLPVLETLAEEAEARNEDDVAGILEALFVVASEGIAS